MTYEESIKNYFGGVKQLAKQTLPYTCKCGDNTFPQKKDGIPMEIPMMSIPDCYRHIRRRHKESIQKNIFTLNV